MEMAGANPLAANSDPSINNNLPIKRANEKEKCRETRSTFFFKWALEWLFSDDETLKVHGESLCIERVYVLLD